MNLQPVDQALVDTLHGLEVGGFGRPCGYVDVPAGAGWSGPAGASPFKPYLTVWPTDAPRDALLLADPHRYVEAQWVVKAVDIDPWSAKQLADEATAALTVADLAAAGVAINWVRVSGPRGPYPDHDTVPPLHVVAITVTARIQSAQEEPS